MRAGGRFLARQLPAAVVFLMAVCSGNKKAYTIEWQLFESCHLQGRRIEYGCGDEWRQRGAAGNR